MSGGPIDLNRVLPANIDSGGGYDAESFAAALPGAAQDPGLLDFYRRNDQPDPRVAGLQEFGRMPPQSPAGYAQGLYDARALLAADPAVPDDLRRAGIGLLDEALRTQAATRDDGWD